MVRKSKCAVRVAVQSTGSEITSFLAQLLCIVRWDDLVPTFAPSEV